MTNRGFALFFFVILMGAGVAFAQSNPEATQLYGQGVHQFNTNRYAEAITYFDQAEGMETQDPRVFFYRGLSHYRLGNEMAAVADYEKAAAMEQTVAGRSYSIPKSLQRVQGPERSIIERYRRAAKRTWETEQNKRRQDEFLIQKSQNEEFYQGIINSGEAAASNIPADMNVNSPLPFGVQPIRPFGGSDLAQRSRTAYPTQTGMRDDNIFIEDVERKIVIEEPKKEIKKPTRLEDPNETGIFDFPDDDDDGGGFVDLDNVLMSGAGSDQRSRNAISINNPLGGNGISSEGDDEWSSEDFSNSGFSGAGTGNIPQSGGMLNNIRGGGDGEQIKEGGRSFGKAFAGIFKKSGDKPSGQTLSAPAIDGDADGVTTPPGSGFDSTEDPFDGDADSTEDPFNDDVDAVTTPPSSGFDSTEDPFDDDADSVEDPFGGDF